MIVHIILLQARPDLSAYEEQELGEAVYGLAAVPGVKDLTWGPDFSGRGRGYTHAAILHFDSRDDLQAYQDHERHKRIVEALNRLAPERLIVDFEAGP